MVYKNNFVAGSKDNPDADGAYVILCTFIVFTMITGFGLLESGCVRAKNEANVMVRCAMDLVVGGAAYWFFGYGFAFGSFANGFCGANNFFLNGIVENTPTMYVKFFFQFAFAAAATTIVSGAVTERIKLKSYIVFAFFNTGFTYPIVAHWLWDKNGWLNALGAWDFAGGSVVHCCGGAASLVGAVLLGARTGRFDKGNENAFRPSKPMNIIVGTFLLWFGWIGFNCGSTFGVSGGAWKVAASTAVVTTLGASGGGLGVVILSFFLERRRKYFLNVGELATGILAGLVAITAVASQCRPADGFIIGFTGGWVAIGTVYLLEYLKVDDPVGCFAIHWSAGAWGMICVGLVAEKDKIVGYAPRNGLFRGGGWYLLGINILAVVCVTLWSALMTTLCFLAMKYSIGLRLSKEEEAAGADFVEHAIEPYSIEKKETTWTTMDDTEDDDLEIATIENEKEPLLLE